MRTAANSASAPAAKCPSTRIGTEAMNPPWLVAAVSASLLYSACQWSPNVYVGRSDDRRYMVALISGLLIDDSGHRGSQQYCVRLHAELKSGGEAGVGDCGPNTPAIGQDQVKGASWTVDRCRDVRCGVFTEAEPGLIVLSRVEKTPRTSSALQVVG